MKLPNSAQLFALISRQETLGPEDSDNARRLSKEEVAFETQKALDQLQQTYQNLFSCFETIGNYGMHRVVQSFIEENKIGLDLIDGAAAYGSARDLADALCLSYETAFVQAFEAQALNRLQLRDNEGRTIWNELAQSEYFDMVRRVRASTKGTRVYPKGYIPPTPAAAAPALSPIDECVQDWQTSMDGKGMEAFRKKWINNENNKRIWEQANAEGKI